MKLIDGEQAPAKAPSATKARPQPAVTPSTTSAKGGAASPAPATQTAQRLYDAIVAAGQDGITAKELARVGKLPDGYRDGIKRLIGQKVVVQGRGPFARYLAPQTKTKAAK